MKQKVKTKQAALETLGHRVEPEIKKMVVSIADRWGESQRFVIESAVRKLHREVLGRRS